MSEPRSNPGLRALLHGDLGEPPLGWRHPVTGRQDASVDPRLERFGRYVRRARYLAGMSQESVSAASGVTQSMISRLERALAPSMGVDRLVMLGEPLTNYLPLGYCPHEHYCQWQPYPPDPPRAEPTDSPVMRWLLGGSATAFLDAERRTEDEAADPTGVADG